MNSPRTALRTAGFIFGIVSVAHAWRVLAQVPLRIGNYDVPMWPSVVAIFASAALALWMWRLAGRSRS